MIFYIIKLLFLFNFLPNLTIVICKNRNSQQNIGEFISTNLSDVKFYLYYVNGDSFMPSRSELIPWNLTSLDSSGYNKALPLKILTHGFMSNSTDEGGFIQRLKNAYLFMNTSVNILAMDWGPLSSVRDRLPIMPYYFKVTKNVPLVGKYLAEMITFLIMQAELSLEHLHLIGFSLGAHVSGIAGQHIQLNTSKSIGRITGLDPAGPVFQNKNVNERLDSTDADFVDVVHTNQGKNGIKGNIGHVDFYPNDGGPKQPGCQNVTEPVRYLAGLCAHSFAYKLFEKSIREPYSIHGCKCESMFTMPCRVFNVNSGSTASCKNPAIFGEHCLPSTRGEFHMDVTLDNGNYTILDQVMPNAKTTSEVIKTF